MPVHYAKDKATRALLRVSMMSRLRAALPGHDKRQAAREEAEEKATVDPETARKEAVVLSYVSQDNSVLGGEDETLVVRTALELGLNKDCTDEVRSSELRRARPDCGALTACVVCAQQQTTDDVRHAQEGNTMLHWSALRGHRELMDLLLERGLNVNAKRNVRLRRRSLTLLCEYGMTDRARLVCAGRRHAAAPCHTLRPGRWRDASAGWRRGHRRDRRGLSPLLQSRAAPWLTLAPMLRSVRWRRCTGPRSWATWSW
jgi:hypothetical protein